LEHRALITPYIRGGLDAGQRVLYIFDDHTPETIGGYLRDDGVDVDACVAKGGLIFRSAVDVFLADGEFDSGAAMSFIRAEASRAAADGYSALRVTEEMTWILRLPPGSSEVLEYGSALNRFVPNVNLMVLCQYPRERFEASRLLNVLTRHPAVIVGDEVYDNFYYVPAFGTEGQGPADTLRSWFANLAERKRADAQFRQEHRFIEAVLDTIGALVIVLGIDGRIRRFNRFCEQATGWTFGEVRNRVFWDFLVPEDEREGVRRAFADLRAGHFPSHYENHWVRRNGEKLLVQWSNTAIVDDNGAVEYIVGTGIDVSDQRWAEEQLARRDQSPQ
jgi:PAS domain S-box-containing protein